MQTLFERSLGSIRTSRCCDSVASKKGLRQAAKKGSGRLQKTNFCERCEAVLLHSSPSLENCERAEGEVPGFADISVRTMQHMCEKRLRVPSLRTSKKLLLIAKMVKNRLAF